MMPQEKNAALLEISHLKKYYPIRSGLLQRKEEYVKAVDDVSLSVHRGETLGLVGESGCGKSTLGRAVLRLTEPTAGSVRLDGEEIASLSEKQLRRYRQKMQIIFQDPYASLNPRMTVGDIVGEPLAIFEGMKGGALRERVLSLLEKVGMDAQSYARSPHEFSGGQRQRICIARALSVSPKLVVCDEPVSALDVSVRAQVLNLMRSLQRELGLAYLFISHDLSVVRHISDRVAVMYLGEIVEIAGRDALYDHPAHPYTLALLSAIPIPDPQVHRERIVLSGDVPSPAHPPEGCRFHPRCPMARPECARERPKLQCVEEGHYVACHRRLEA